jgi:predicted O-methyltransferase YrrM
MSVDTVTVEPAVVRYSGNFYLNKKETAILVALIASAMPKVVVEFGVNLGITAKVLLDSIPSIETYIGIDVPYGYQPRLNCQRSEVPACAGRYATADPRFYSLILDDGSSSLAAEDLEPIDAAFIDGDHSAVGVTSDSVLARRLLRPGGIIVWHDYGNTAVEVTTALDTLVDKCSWPIKRVKDTALAFMRAE